MCVSLRLFVACVLWTALGCVHAQCLCHGSEIRRSMSFLLQKRATAP